MTTIKKSATQKIKTGCGNLYVTLTEDFKKIFVFFKKSGHCQQVMLEGLGRMINLVLEKGGSIEEITAEIEGMTCPNRIEGIDDQNKSCIDALCKGIRRIIENKFF